MANPFKLSEKYKTTLLAAVVITLVSSHCYGIYTNYIEKMALMTDSSHGSSLAERYLYHEDWPASKTKKSSDFVKQYQIPGTLTNKKDLIDAEAR